MAIRVRQIASAPTGRATALPLVTLPPLTTVSSGPGEKHRPANLGIRGESPSARDRHALMRQNCRER